VSRLLVVTAVAVERDAIGALDGIDDMDVIVGGVGPVEAAVSTARALERGSYDAVLSAGIAGGFPGSPLGSIVLASSIVFADLGAETADGFVAVDDLGFGRTRYDATFRPSIGAREGTILTVSTVTGTAAVAAQLQARYPDAVAEAMEGAGVAAAACLRGVPFAEIRAISNPVGPRQRDLWDVPAALDALGRAVAAVAVAAAGQTSAQWTS
jgi:futalosine hydrolase